MQILLQVHNKINSFKTGDLAYMVNFLMMVMATTETCQNMA